MAAKKCFTKEERVAAKRLRDKKYFDEVKLDPIRYAAHLQRKRISSAKYAAEIRSNPIWHGLRNKKCRAYSAEYRRIHLESLRKQHREAMREFIARVKVDPKLYAVYKHKKRMQKTKERETFSGQLQAAKAQYRASDTPVTESLVEFKAVQYMINRQLKGKPCQPIPQKYRHLQTEMSEPSLGG